MKPTLVVWFNRVGHSVIFTKAYKQITLCTYTESVAGFEQQVAKQTSNKQNKYHVLKKTNVSWQPGLFK